MPKGIWWRGTGGRGARENRGGSGRGKGGKWEF